MRSTATRERKKTACESRTAVHNLSCRTPPTVISFRAILKHHESNLPVACFRRRTKRSYSFAFDLVVRFFLRSVFLFPSRSFVSVLVAAKDSDSVFAAHDWGAISKVSLRCAKLEIKFVEVEKNEQTLFRAFGAI